MDTTEKAFQYASEASKLTTAISTAVITFTITFGKELSFLTPSSAFQSCLLLIAWLALLTSAGAGIWVHLALVSVLEPRIKSVDHAPTIRARKTMIPFQTSLIAFSVGVLTLVIYGAFKIFF